MHLNEDILDKPFYFQPYTTIIHKSHVELCQFQHGYRWTDYTWRIFWMV